MREQEDAFGRALLDQLERGDARIVVERDDGYVETETIAWYFGGLRQWHPSERQALRHVRGRVLDIGAGAGRAALELQKRGHEVVAVDISPLAIDVCRKRGVRDARVLPVTKIDSSLGTFDTVALFGNNFGLFSTARRARWMLRRLRARDDARGAHHRRQLRPVRTKNPDDLAYFEQNRKRGRLGGQIRLRVRYKAYATPWVDYLMVSLDEMREIVAGTGWEIDDVLTDDNFFVGVIARVVKLNRSVPEAVVIPELPYRDVREAVDWLTRAFGFRERLQIGDHRAQLVYEDGAVIVIQRDEPAPANVLVRVSDATAHHEQAAAAGRRS